MSKLLEHILNSDYVSANDLFESYMEEIAERKIYEAKRDIAAQMNEVMGRQSVAALRAKGYRKATDVLGLSPYDIKTKRVSPVKKAAPAAAPVSKKRKAAPEPEDKPAVDQAKDIKRPGIIARNLNTLVGKEAGYRAEPKRPEQKGGRVGKAINIAYKGLSRFGSEMGSSWE